MLISDASCDKILIPSILVSCMLWNLVGDSTEMLPTHLPNFRAPGKLYTSISRLWDYARYYDPTHSCFSLSSFLVGQHIQRQRSPIAMVKPSSFLAYWPKRNNELPDVFAFFASAKAWNRRSVIRSTAYNLSYPILSYCYHLPRNMGVF